MKVYVENTLASGTVGWGVVGEPSDRASFPLVLCIRNPSNNAVIAYDYRVYKGWDIDPPVTRWIYDVTDLNDGEYVVTIENDTACNGNIVLAKYPIYKRGSLTNIVLSTSVVGGIAFSIQVYNGKLYWWRYDATTAFVIPNADAVVEIVDREGNGFVGMGRWSSSVLVEPNVKVPFGFSFDIVLKDPKARSVVGSMIDMFGVGKVAFEAVDDYTIRVYVYKDEVGIPVLAVLVVGVVIIGILYAANILVQSIGNLMVMKTASEVSTTVSSRLDTILQLFKEQYVKCTTDECRAAVASAFAKALAGLSGMKITVEQQVAAKQACDGFMVGGVCVPWWALMLGVVVLMLLVVK
jgi:hypothetical protein